MKPRNFPGRKNQRRIEALERMKINFAKGGVFADKTAKYAIEHLEAIIAKPFQTHTKKSRGLGIGVGFKFGN
jgi:hypothetical protein